MEHFSGAAPYNIDTVLWDDALCSVGALSNGNTPADPVAFGASGTNRPLLYAFGVNEDMDGSLQIPHSYAEGTDIVMHVHWAPAVATGGNVQWRLSYYWLSVGESASGAPTDVDAEGAAGTTTRAHKITNFAALSGSGKSISSILIFKIKRIAASADELAGDAFLLSIDAHFRKNSLGSRGEATK